MIMKTNNKALLSLSLAVLFFISSGCVSTKSISSMPEITVEFKDFEESENVLQFMDRGKPIIVETRGDTIMSSVFERIIENDGIFYVLDANANKVFGFDKDGKINAYVSSRGKSNLEYIKITDIAWDKTKDCLVILAQNKLLYADKTGHIFDFTQLETYYRSIAICGDNIILSNSTYVNKNHSSHSISVLKKDGTITELLPTLPEYAPFCSVNGPSLTSISDNVLFARLFDPNIYSISKGNSVSSKIGLNFDSRLFIPKDGTEYDCMDLYAKCNKAKQFYSLSDFQEGESYLTCKSNIPGIMIISKESESFKSYKFLYDYDGKVPLTSYIPVENSDNIVFFYMDSTYFPMFAKHSGDRELIDLASKLTPGSNPIFLPYRLK